MLERGSLNFELGFDAQRRESATVGEQVLAGRLAKVGMDAQTGD